jgi:polyhydroxybutyrate depolymerase
MPRRVHSVLTAALSSILILAGSGPATSSTASTVAKEPSGVSATASTSTTGTMVVNGEERSYELFVPASAGAKPPLIVALHGLYGSGARFRTASGWDAVAARAGAVVAYPDSYESGWRSQAGEVRDVRFLSRLVARLVDQEHVNPRRVYAVGFSSGAFMSYRLACTRSRIVTAIGPMAGSPATDCLRAPKRAVPVISIHGTADQVVPYAGGEPNVPGIPISGVDLPSAREVARRWVRHNGCRPAPRTRSSSVARTDTWRGCHDRVRVRLVSIKGWPHQYPGPDSGSAVNATTTTWRYLRQFRMPA